MLAVVICEICELSIIFYYILYLLAVRNVWHDIYRLRRMACPGTCIFVFENTDYCILIILVPSAL